MASTKTWLLCILSVFFLTFLLTNAAVSRTSRTRVHLPWLGIGPHCDVCPQHFCDDDPAIVHGYCCGCARFYDVLPVQCGLGVVCPLNNYDLCEDYEYMMHCCCS